MKPALLEQGRTECAADGLSSVASGVNRVREKQLITIKTRM
ncbi:hypothetical protein C4K04_4961 [Pseudomonas chlororaphis]|uniref:Uncharacterized protein n=1 Tax=Pseudomonas chlororaphis TaxID=587753 RepID=A0A3G7TW23_9PSED|nr:hypothetical protein C4K04_4961 [Pseudomonas chlororaphis]